MTHNSTLDKIKHLAGETLKIPVAAAGAAVGLARTVAERVAGGIGSAIAQRPEGSSAVSPVPTEAAPDVGPDARPAVDPEEPVNVTEELGLDPAPVAKPTKRRAAPKPVTEIDAAADAAAVDVTPADVAEVVAPTAPVETTDRP